MSLLDDVSIVVTPNGYKAGTLYSVIPSSGAADMDVTRATAATRVDENGLVNYAEVLGSELVVNGDFEINPSIGNTWTDTDGRWTWNSTTKAMDVVNGAFLLNSGVVESGKTYKCTFTISNITGSIVSLRLGGVNGANFNTNGTHTAYITSGGTTIEVYGYGAFDGSIDNVSVKEATIDGLARVDYTDGTGSLLVEPQRTNLITYSEDFTDSSWTNAGVTVTVTPNNATSPDGTLNASSIELTSGDFMYFTHNTTINVGDTYTWSCFVKSSSLKINWGGGTPDGTDINTVEALSNGWYRQVLQRTFTATGTGMQAMFAESVAGAGLFDVWGASLEQGSYATSYIKTQGSTVTRNQDEYTKTGISDKINSEEGVLFLEVAYLTQTSPTTKEISLNDGTNANRVALRLNTTTNQIRAIVRVGGSNQFTVQNTISNVTNYNKIALKYKENDFALWLNGVELDTDTSGSIPSGLNQLDFDEGNGASVFCGKVKQLQVFKTALSDSELATLTTI
jgi:hypothetical protein